MYNEVFRNRQTYKRLIKGLARISKGGRFLKNPVFSRSFSTIFFYVADFHGQFKIFSPKWGHSYAPTHCLRLWVYVNVTDPLRHYEDQVWNHAAAIF
jgi:hypothetical protein